jgi:hypothetical protein
MPRAGLLADSGRRLRLSIQEALCEIVIARQSSEETQQKHFLRENLRNGIFGE